MDAVAVVVGSIVVLWVIASAIRTVVIPRPERGTLGWGIFAAAQAMARWLARIFKSPQRRERILGAAAPVTMVAYPAVWSVGIVFGFAAIFLGLDDEPFTSALVLSASSLTTLGFATAPTDGLRLIATVEALLGLGIVALMISFLPTIYGTFSRREIAAGRLTVRAGEPPQPVDYLVRTHLIGTLHLLDDRWSAWEDWFVELGETHTTFPQLIFFRSQRPERSWITSAEAALDTAALITACQFAPRTGKPETMIRAGFLALNNIATFLRIPYDPQPGRHTSISVTRNQFDRLIEELSGGGLHLGIDQDDAWEAFRGWRVNYDEALRGIVERLGEIESHWRRFDV